MENQEMFQWKLKFSDTESDPSEKYDTDHLNKHPNSDDDMASFDKITIEFLQKYIFIETYVPCFDAKISAMKGKIDETLSNPKWGFL